MENPSNKKKVTFIENDKHTSSLVLKEFSHLYGNEYLNTIDKEHLILEDIIGLEELISGSEIIVFQSDFSIVENEDELIKRLKGIENIVNAILSSNVLQFIFISSFSPNYGTHYQQIITEKTIWEFSSSLDMHSKFIHLSRQEVSRGLHEGMDTSILSCGNILNKPQNEKDGIFTIHPKDVAYAIISEINSKNNNHLILVNNDYTKDVESTPIVHTNFFSKLMVLFKGNSPKRSIISLDISETKKILNKPFMEIS